MALFPNYDVNTDDFTLVITYRVYMFIAEKEMLVVDVPTLEAVTQCISTCIQNQTPVAVFKNLNGGTWQITGHGDKIDKALEAIGKVPMEYKSFLETK